MKQEERRNRSTEKLIQAYLELAAEQGVASITFDSIGQRAGYSRGLAFQKFGSKDGLLEAVISYLHEEAERIRAASHKAGDDGLADLVLFCRHHLHALQNGYENKAYFVLLSSAIAERSELRTHFEDSHARSEVIISGLVKQGQADGSIRTDIDPKQTALLVGTQLIGISTQYLVHPDYDVSAAFEALRCQIIRAYGSEPSQRLLDVPAEDFATV